MFPHHGCYRVVSDSVCGKSLACTNSGYQSILHVFLWPGNELEASATAVDKTHPGYFLLFPSCEKNFFTNSYSQQQVILGPWKNDIVVVLVWTYSLSTGLPIPKGREGVWYSCIQKDIMGYSLQVLIEGNLDGLKMCQRNNWITLTALLCTKPPVKCHNAIQPIQIHTNTWSCMYSGSGQFQESVRRLKLMWSTLCFVVKVWRVAESKAGWQWYICCNVYHNFLAYGGTEEAGSCCS